VALTSTTTLPGGGVPALPPPSRLFSATSGSKCYRQRALWMNAGASTVAAMMSIRMCASNCHAVVSVPLRKFPFRMSELCPASLIFAI